MTVTPAASWCPTCQEMCRDHATICTVCGSPLQPEPEDRIAFNSIGLGPSEPVRNTEPPTERQEPRERLRSGLETIDDTEFVQLRRDIAAAVRRGAFQSRGIAQSEGIELPLPAEAMDPQGAGSTERPTSQKVLDELNRTVLTPRSSLLYQADVQISVPSQNNRIADAETRVVRTMELQAVLGEFGPTPPYPRISLATLIIAQPPRTARGGRLDDTTVTQIQYQSNTRRRRVLVYLERGDNVTFAQKAMLAQQAGASAVIIGNRTAEPWPYIMKDSREEASKGGVPLTIPVVMISQKDGQELIELCKEADGESAEVSCSLGVQTKTNDCVVCHDELFQVGQTVIPLPACGHVFHEECAMTWLRRHNSCPYCRRELPTDNADYEQERRRTERTHVGGNRGSSGGETFYG